MEEQAILRFTDLLTSYPGNIDDVDLDALGGHLNTDQVVELVAGHFSAKLHPVFNAQIRGQFLQARAVVAVTRNFVDYLRVLFERGG